MHKVLDKEIKSNEIGKIVMIELLKLDHVAYIRFASVYFNFNDTESFSALIKNLENNLSPEMKKDKVIFLKMIRETDKYYLDMTLKLAEKGEFTVYPNPKVGAVIVKTTK